MQLQTNRIETCSSHFNHVFKQWLPKRLVGTETAKVFLNVIKDARLIWACNISAVSLDMVSEPDGWKEFIGCWTALRLENVIRSSGMST